MIRQRIVQTETEGITPEPDDMTGSKDKNRKKSARFHFLKIALIVIFILYVVIPCSFYFSSTLRRHVVFLHYISLSRHKNLTAPSELGLNCTRNFYVESDDGIKLGIWHVPPQQYHSQCRSGHLPIDREFSDLQPVFLYLHGNAGSRGGNHRMQLYKVLSEKLNAHIVAFDYRGFGDSSSAPPSEAGVVQDTHNVYNWLTKHVDRSRIVIWGHSLGTGVGVAFLDSLPHSKLPAGLVLEAPFTKIIDAARYHPLSLLHRHMPFFDFFIGDPISEKATAFNSISRIRNVKCPLLILHAEDDGFVPFHLGRELYSEALASRQDLDPHATKFVSFNKEFNFGHKHIWKSPDLPNIISDFIESNKVIR